MPRDQPHLMGAVAQAARKSWERRQGLSTKGSSAGLSDVLSDVSSAYGLRVGHFSFIVSRTDFRMCELTKNTKYSNLNHEKGME